MGTSKFRLGLPVRHTSFTSQGDLAPIKMRCPKAGEIPCIKLCAKAFSYFQAATLGKSSHASHCPGLGQLISAINEGSSCSLIMWQAPTQSSCHITSAGVSWGRVIWKTSCFASLESNSHFRPKGQSVSAHLLQTLHFFLLLLSFYGSSVHLANTCLLARSPKCRQITISFDLYCSFAFKLWFTFAIMVNRHKTLKR